MFHHPIYDRSLIDRTIIGLVFYIMVILHQLPLNSFLISGFVTEEMDVARWVAVRSVVGLDLWVELQEAPQCGGTLSIRTNQQMTRQHNNER